MRLERNLAVCGEGYIVLPHRMTFGWGRSASEVFSLSEGLTLWYQSRRVPGQLNINTTLYILSRVWGLAGSSAGFWKGSDTKENIAKSLTRVCSVEQHVADLSLRIRGAKRKTGLYVGLLYELVGKHVDCCVHKKEKRCICEAWHIK